jgi:hypothetical protein
MKCWASKFSTKNFWLPSVIDQEFALVPQSSDSKNQLVKTFASGPLQHNFLPRVNTRLLVIHPRPWEELVRLGPGAGLAGSGRGRR